MPSIGLYVFERDCRVDDNSTLSLLACQVDYLICLYCVEPMDKFAKNFSQTTASSAQRGYIKQTLLQLHQRLVGFGQHLMVVEANINPLIAELIVRYQITHIAYSRYAGSYEQSAWKSLKQQYPAITFVSTVTNNLFEQWQLPFEIEKLPESFTAFRKVTETIKVNKPYTNIKGLPPSPLNLIFTLPEQIAEANNPFFSGGELNAQLHLNEYFSTQAASHYKETRNALQGRYFSTLFSPYLAHGALSPRQVMQSLNEYEEAHGANESSYWIYFELLWREYFYWYGRKHQERLFFLSGIGKNTPLFDFCPTRFAAWCSGNTRFSLVNALMHQLNQSGWMSNRGRQIVASCLVNELGIDWRYGAAYFEQRLIDYDVSSNWGNWQYIAGVGADPRGGRHFNIDKQTQMYDPKGEFISRWISLALAE